MIHTWKVSNCKPWWSDKRQQWFVHKWAQEIYNPSGLPGQGMYMYTCELGCDSKIWDDRNAHPYIELDAKGLEMENKVKQYD